MVLIPVVGEAIVKVRVIGDRVGDDISRAVRSGARDAEGDLDASGNRAGSRWSNAVNNGVRRGRGSREAEGERAGADVERGLRRQTDRDRPVLANLFAKSGRDSIGSFGKEFNLGIGAARMGPAILSAVALMAPSVLSGFASLGAALGAQLVSTIAAAAPAIAGAGALGVAALATLGLNFGLLKLAFASTSDAGKALKKDMADLKTSLTETFAPGVLSGFTDMVSRLKSDLLPAIRDQLAATGVAMGDVARGFAETVTSGENLSRIQGILATNTTFLGNFKTGVSGLTTSFLILFDAAKPFVDFLGEAIAKFGTWAAASLSVSEANGSLATFMQHLLDALKSGAQAIGDLIVGLYNIGKAAAPAGGSLSDIAAKFREWTSDPANQERMTKFFEKMHTLVSGLAGLFGGLASAAGGALEKMDPTNILAIFQIITDKIAPALADLWNQVQSGAGDNLVKVFDNIGTALQKIVDSGSFETVARLASEFLLAISNFAASDFGATVLGWVAPLLLFGGTFSSIAEVLISIGSAIAGVGAAVLAPVLLIAGGIALLWANSQTFRDAIMGIVTEVQGRFGPIWDNLQPKLEKAWAALQRLAGIIGDILAPIIVHLGEIIGTVFTFIGDFIGNALSVLGSLFSIFGDILTGNWSQLWTDLLDFFSGVWDLIKTALQDGWDFLFAIFSGIANIVGTAFTAAWNVITSILQGIWNVIVSVWTSIMSFLSGVWDAILSAVTTAWTSVTDFLSMVWTAIQIVAETIWNNIVSFFTGLWDGITGGIKAAWDGVTSFLSDIWQGILTGLQVFGGLIFEIAMTPWRLLVFFFDAIWQVIGGTLTAAWDWIAATATAVWGAITGFFSTVWDGVSSAAVAAWTTISDFLSSVWNGIVSVATTIWNALVAFFGFLWDSLLTGVQVVWGWITSFLSAVWAGIVSVATTIWNGVLAFFQTVWTGIQTVFTTVLDAIVAFLEFEWSGIQNTASAIWTAISTFFQTIWDAISNVFHSVVDPLVQWLGQRWQDISDTASNIWDSISQLASDLWNAIIDAIESVVEPIVGWLQEKWDAITSAVSSAWDGLSGIVGEIWNAVKSAIITPIEEAWNRITELVGWIGDLITGILSTVSDAFTTVNSNIESMQASAAAASAIKATTSADVATQISGIGTTTPSKIERMFGELLGSAHLEIPFGGALARGGTVPAVAGGQMFQLGEAGRRERVEPLDSQGLSTRDRAMIAMIVKSMLPVGAGSNSTAVNVRIGERELTDIVTDVQANRDDSLARRARLRRPQ